MLERISMPAYALLLRRAACERGHGGEIQTARRTGAMKRTIFALAAFLGATAPAAAQLAGATAATSIPTTPTTATTTTPTTGGGAATPIFAPPIEQRLVEWDITSFG